MCGMLGYITNPFIISLINERWMICCRDVRDVGIYNQPPLSCLTIKGHNYDVNGIFKGDDSLSREAECWDSGARCHGTLRSLIMINAVLASA